MYVECPYAKGTMVKHARGCHQWAVGQPNLLKRSTIIQVIHKYYFRDPLDAPTTSLTDNLVSALIRCNEREEQADNDQLTAAVNLTQDKVELNPWLQRTR